MRSIRELVVDVGVVIFVAVVLYADRGAINWAFQTTRAVIAGH
jgi:hypothetical protein